jgi:hypothetical protein
MSLTPLTPRPQRQPESIFGDCYGCVVEYQVFGGFRDVSTRSAGNTRNDARQRSGGDDGGNALENGADGT